MFTDDEKRFAESIDQPTLDDAPAKQRARPKKPTRSEKMARPAKEQAQSKRGPGRPKGAKNKFTIEKERIQKALNREKLGPEKIVGPMKEPKDILIEAANFWWGRAMFLSDHAKHLAELDASSAQVDATIVESDRYLQMACKAAEQASPYFHARVSGGSADGDVIAYVARLPAPVEDSEQWAKESNPHPKRPQ